MERSFRSRATLLFMCGLICLVGLAATFQRTLARDVQFPYAQSSDFATPRLVVQSYAERDVVSVSGQGFSPGGKVYLAIYDQMGKQLYENRWVTASARTEMFDAGVLTSIAPEDAYFSLGGMLREQFAGLCGASALIRALDDATERWTDFQVVQPLCASAAGPSVANGLLRPESLPMTALNPAGATVANDLNTVRAPALREAASTSIPGSLAVTGAGFAAGGRVYVAIYDQMGATLYETRWVTATPSIAITGGGMLSTTFNGLCGADVLIRAYDQHTGFWTNWLESAPFCDAAPVGYGPH